MLDWSQHRPVTPTASVLCNNLNENIKRTNQISKKGGVTLEGLVLVIKLHCCRFNHVRRETAHCAVVLFCENQQRTNWQGEQLYDSTRGSGEKWSSCLAGGGPSVLNSSTTICKRKIEVMFHAGLVDLDIHCYILTEKGTGICCRNQTFTSTTPR